MRKLMHNGKLISSSRQPRLYRTVVDDVVKNVRESFLNEGVDEQVLQELKQVIKNC